jgi:MFS family permease
LIILAFIGSFAIGLNFFISPVATQLCEWYNPRVVTILGGVISIAGLLTASFVTTSYGMILSYSIVWGTGSSLCYASTFVVVGKLFHKHLAFAMGFVTAGSGVGGLAMSPSIERMLETFGWKTTMRALAILTSCLIISAFTYREPIVSQERTSTNKSWRQLFDCSLWCIPAFSMLTVSLTIFNFGYYIPIIHVVRLLNTIT